MNSELFVLGATGFIGQPLLQTAVKSGIRVRALVRSDEGAALIERLGASPVRGDAAIAGAWAQEMKGAALLVDLLQPKLPRRLSLAAVRRIAALRVHMTRSIVGALESLSPSERPLVVSVSGTSDLEPDAQGRVSHRSRLRDLPVGFAHIGLPVRRVITQSALPAVFVHFGTVYGPGKSFAERLLPDLARGKVPIVGRGANRLPLVHVADAAAALVHLAGLDRSKTSGRTFVVADGADTTQREFLQVAARLMGGPHPRRVPRWLASLVIGSVLAEMMSEDCATDPSALLTQGFRFTYPSCRTGIPVTLEALGLAKAGTARAHAEAVS